LFVHKFLVDNGLVQLLVDTCRLQHSEEVEGCTLAILSDLASSESLCDSLRTPGVTGLCSKVVASEAASTGTLVLAAKLCTLIESEGQCGGPTMLDFISAAHRWVTASMGNPDRLFQSLELLLSALHVSENTACRISHGIHKLVLEVLATHRDSEPVVFYALRALELMGRGGQGSEARHQTLIDSGVVPACRDAMLAFPASSRVAEASLTVLMRLSESVGSRDSLASSGVHEWAVEQMSLHIQDGGVVKRAGELILELHEVTPAKNLSDYHNLRSSVTEFLIQESSLNTLVAAMNIHQDVGCREDGFSASGIIICTLQVLLTKPDLFPRLQELHIPELVRRYARSSKREGDLKLLEAVQVTAKISAVEHMREQVKLNAHTPAEDAFSLLLDDDDLEVLVEDHLKNAHLMGTLKYKTPSLSTRTLPPLCTRVLYIPDQGQKWLDGFCARFQQCGLSVLNVMGCKNPSALKRQLALQPQLIVCTHHTSQAKAGSK
ncbi:hypothetical protein KIPB_011296, partial [Kipferlia bialata]